MAGIKVLNRKEMLKFNLMIASVVWAGWYFLGGDLAIASLMKNWAVSLTMVAGSLIGGATSEGSGAVAFPVFTKLLKIPAEDARIFCLAIQSIGMTCASLSIIYAGVKIEWRAIRWAGPAGMLGLLVSTLFIVPVVSASLVKVAFTIMLASLAIAMVIMNKNEHKSKRHDSLPVFGDKEKAFLMAAGFAGGLMSGVVGCGENIATFMAMVLLFRITETIATPTTVILMTIVTIFGFGLHALVLGTFTPTLVGYWLAAVPVSCVMGPLGALLCTYMPRKLIVNTLLTLISLEFISTLILVPISGGVACVAAATLISCGLLNWYMVNTDIYAPKAEVVPVNDNEDEYGRGMAAPALAYARA